MIELKKEKKNIKVYIEIDDTKKYYLNEDSKTKKLVLYGINRDSQGAFIHLPMKLKHVLENRRLIASLYNAGFLKKVIKETHLLPVFGN